MLYNQVLLTQIEPSKVLRKTSFPFEVLYFRPARNTDEMIVKTKTKTHKQTKPAKHKELIQE